MGHMQAGMVFRCQCYSQSGTLITGFLATYLRVMYHLGIVAILLLSLCHITINDTCILAMGHQRQRC